jgi:hypothetical protein
VSAKFPTPLTPAGWAFGIWGVIFLLEGWGALYQLLPSGYDPDGFKASNPLACHSFPTSTAGAAAGRGGGVAPHRGCPASNASFLGASGFPAPST